MAKETKVKSNFDLVARGKCPHDNASLGDEVAGRKVGITRVCSKCKHVWYLIVRYILAHVEPVRKLRGGKAK
jgi:hypothetical protein